MRTGGGGEETGGGRGGDEKTGGGREGDEETGGGEDEVAGSGKTVRGEETGR